jgi:ubiquinone/menaquinone biosynthesis C-methylase UbiE
MDQDLTLSATFNPELLAKDEMNWDAYAEHYDLMCELNPAYQENIQLLLSRISSWDLPSAAKICDMGAGTGNYISAIAERFPHAEFFHVDFDSRMNELARAKYDSNGVSNVQFVEDHILHSRLPPSTMDLVICVNSIYAVNPQRAMLERVHDLLAPTGRLFAIDFGRKQRTLDWAIYLFREAMKSGKVGRYARGLLEGREVMRQNRQSTKGQASGRYWLHSTDEFGASLEHAGFIVEELSPCYRGYADMAVCRVRRL